MCVSQKNVILDDDGFDMALIKAWFVANMKALAKRKIKERKDKVLGKATAVADAAGAVKV